MRVFSIKHIRLLILLILSLSIFHCSFAQQMGQFVEESQEVYIPFTITNYGTKHGLPQNQIIDIIAKKDGELILATANGIVSYNGNEFSNFIPNTHYKKVTHTRLFYSENTNVLFGLEINGKLNEISPTFKTIRTFKAVCTFENSLFGIDANGKVYRFDPESRTTTQILKSSINNANAIFFDGIHFWVANEHGLDKISSRTQLIQHLSNEPINLIQQNPYTSEIYFLSMSNAYKLSSKDQLTSVDLGSKPTNVSLTDIVFTDENEIYISSNKGLFYISDMYSEWYDEKTFFPSENILSLQYNAAEDCIFLGTSNKGLLKLHVKNCASLLQYPDLSKSSLVSIIRSSSGKILTGGSNKTIYQVSIDGASIFTQTSAPIASLAEIDHLIFVGTWGSGVLLYQGQQPIGSIHFPQLRDNTVHSVFKDQHQRIWIGTGNGVSVGNSIPEIRPLLPKQITGKIITIYELKNGNILLGGTQGIYEINSENAIVRQIGEKEGLHCKEVRSFYEDQAHKRWIGTYDGGLYCWNKGQLKCINNLPNCKLNTDIFTLARDQQGYIYMSSNVGLWVVEEKKLNDFYNGKIRYLVPFYYGNESGILNTEFNGGFQNNYAQSVYDHFYFPTIEGMVIVNPDNYKFRKLIPKIKNIKVNDNSIQMTENVFKRTAQTIEFGFYCPNYIGKFNVYYQYKLEGSGLPDVWSKMQKSGNIHLSFLQPGDYIIHVRAIDGYNDAHPHVTSYSFTISSYFYETLWFKLILVVLLIGGVAWYIRFKINAHKAKEAKENAINNTMLELKLKAIQAKMNPHFIFNSLNNIQYLIVLGKKDDAEMALSEFSLLLRKFLQQSDKSFIRLSEEIAILQLYVSIEQFRFDEELEVDFEVRSPAENAVIPTLLIQPVVENAIKHGLSHKEGLRRIHLQAHWENDTLLVCIEDNGIGREASKNINAYRDGHVSHGWQLVTDKIKMIREKYGVAIEFDIFDKVSPDTGTTVTFKIPKVDDKLLDN